jgi:hypothetical protein
MINPATSWFEIVQLPTVAQETIVTPEGKGKKVTFDTNTNQNPTLTRVQLKSVT